MNKRCIYIVWDWAETYIEDSPFFTASHEGAVYCLGDRETSSLNSLLELDIPEPHFILIHERAIAPYRAHFPHPHKANDNHRYFGEGEGEIYFGAVEKKGLLSLRHPKFERLNIDHLFNEDFEYVWEAIERGAWTPSKSGRLSHEIGTLRKNLGPLISRFRRLPPAKQIEKYEAIRYKVGNFVKKYPRFEKRLGNILGSTMNDGFQKLKDDLERLFSELGKL